MEKRGLTKVGLIVAVGCGSLEELRKSPFWMTCEQAQSILQGRKEQKLLNAGNFFARKFLG